MKTINYLGSKQHIFDDGYQYTDADIALYLDRSRLVTFVDVAEKASNDGYTWWDASEQCASVIRSLGPYRFFVTITFQVLLQKHQAVAQASTIQRRVKRTVLGKHWLKRNRDQGLEGLAFLEKASVLCPSPGKPRSKRAKGNFHFHILIKDHPRLPRDDAEALRKLRIAYSRAIRQLWLPGTKRALVSQGTGIKVLLVDPKRVEGLFRYCVKGTKKRDWRWDEWVFFLAPGGLI